MKGRVDGNRWRAFPNRSFSFDDSFNCNPTTHSCSDISVTFT